ncbi:MAG: hypothetical protein ACKOSS_03155, partial [Planctomycetia bacterium]
MAACPASPPDPTRAARPAARPPGARHVRVGRGLRLRGLRLRGLRGLCALVLGLLAGALGFVRAPLLYDAAGASPQAYAYGVAYTRIYWFGG